MNTVSERCPAVFGQDVDAAVDAAARAITRGELVVIPTDTVYGIGADAFDPVAVKALLAAKGRGREMPPPVLVASAATLDALAVRVPDWARGLTRWYCTFESILRLVPTRTTYPRSFDGFTGRVQCTAMPPSLAMLRRTLR